MLVLLPPSETKRDGGGGPPLDLTTLSYPRLGPGRRAAVKALRTLARDPEAAMRALKLGPRLEGEVVRNRTLTTSPTMPAIERYTGVLYDALDAASLPAAARDRAAASVRISSALFGLLGAEDAIPAYRLSHDSRIPDLALKAHWSSRVARELRETAGPILDLRSEGYVTLGPPPDRADSIYLRVVTRGEDGETRALNHFNKHGKGAFLRALLLAEETPRTIEELVDWAPTAGFELRPGERGELDLVLR